MGNLTKILIGIILTLVIGISIYVPITNSKIIKINKEMVAKDTVISQLHNVNDELTQRLQLVQKLNDDFNKSITTIQLSTNAYQNKTSDFTLESNIVPTKSTNTLISVNGSINSIFQDMKNLDSPPPINSNKKDTNK